MVDVVVAYRTRARVSIAKLASELELACGVKLMAAAPEDTVHGYINVAEGGSEIVLYTSAETPNVHRRTTAREHGLTKAQLVVLRATVDAHVP